MTREVIEPEHGTTLIVARGGSQVNLSWNSQTGMCYTVLYSEKLSGVNPWRELPGAINLRGTGDTMTFSDNVNPVVNRYYRLRIGPAALPVAK
jgi:hypothetical protein